jgi:protein-tyrosine phosphatase
MERPFVGSLQDAERLSRGNPNRISTVITLCEQSVEHKAKGVLYIHLPIVDAEPVPMRQFEAVMKATAKGVLKGIVLLHCAVGYSRSPTLTAAYMHRTGYKNFDAAIAEIKMLRPLRLASCSGPLRPFNLAHPLERCV